MDEVISKVKEFNEKYGLSVGNLLTDTQEQGDLEVLLLRLIKEETSELEAALYNCDESETLDAIGDLMYVVVGFALRTSIPLEDVFNEVHRSNMSKLGEDGKPIYREDGKLLKGPNFTPPDFTEIIESMKEYD